MPSFASRARARDASRARGGPPRSRRAATRHRYLGQARARGYRRLRGAPHSDPSTGRSEMIYTQSCLRTFRKCPRLFKHVYLDLYRPIQEAEPLRFGAMWHELRDLYWTEGYAAAGRHSFDAQDGFDTARLIAMLRGYHARWESS